MKSKKSIFKKWWLCLISALVVFVLCTGCAATSDTNDSSSSEESTSDESNDGTVKSGSYTLPSGMSVYFKDSVRNDVTGNWRLSTTSDSIVPADCALEYYEMLFSSDDEVHAIWNATLGTTTCIRVDIGCLFVDTYEYVDGEEHDANLLFSGMLLDSRIISIETGEPLDFE